MTHAFAHLHVASAFSLRYGTAFPAALVRRAAEHGMDTLALTDRDGLYGAIKHVIACHERGVRPVVGVDLALDKGSSSDDLFGGGLPSTRPPRGRHSGHGARPGGTAGRAGAGSSCSRAPAAGRRCAAWSRPPTKRGSAASRTSRRGWWPSTRPARTAGRG
ncbi:PHP domain-containing protein [Microbispora sp. GKU 823]|uniref:PHP domain-containing protein n=1 Tax=Microbispora sp. GKU 823 TaxID=1652100 RepID=UPI002118D756|nr:PHP domain-containing protein [Microbispora sp. GKU 823]